MERLVELVDARDADCFLQGIGLEPLLTALGCFEVLTIIYFITWLLIDQSLSVLDTVMLVDWLRGRCLYWSGTILLLLNGFGILEVVNRCPQLKSILKLTFKLRITLVSERVMHFQDAHLQISAYVIHSLRNTSLLRDIRSLFLFLLQVPLSLCFIQLISPCSSFLVITLDFFRSSKFILWRSLVFFDFLAKNFDLALPTTLWCLGT